MRKKTKTLSLSRLSKKEAVRLLKKGDLLELGRMADGRKKALHPGDTITFVVDRNINYTNVCINECRFCAFYRREGAPGAYVLGMNELFGKIEETLALGGTQILLQGGLNPSLGIKFHMNMLREIKYNFPSINIHGYSPPEICYFAKCSSLTTRETLGLLKAAGLDSIPGGGAEVLSDRVREAISPKKIRSSQWLSVMREAHGLGMRTTATMMFGSVETAQDIASHLEAIRELQDETGGFTAFIPWSFQPGNTALKKTEPATAVDYLRVLAVSRIFLDNVPNIQASWVTQGLKMAQVALRFGANDFGSTMIEENVVASAGVSYSVSMNDIIEAIKASGLRPAQRDTRYNIIRYF
ncbi:MAG: dehypoxanthine futalosine cyclase [Nitrospiraceae bacterium]|nr:dehypoxanthine futalosine cyclase [Nitrospiraceae bacterium]MDA8089624.1 dehypoxanthine futalosine cyclase [Nitrospiraceae bacterium]